VLKKDTLYKAQIECAKISHRLDILTIDEERKKVKEQVEKQENERAKKELEEKESKICPLCLENPVGNITFVPCGHYGYCEGCIKKLRKSSNECPNCRQEIEKSIKLFSVVYNVLILRFFRREYTKDIHKRRKTKQKNKQKS
jgi:hypothetical protein